MEGNSSRHSQDLDLNPEGTKNITFRKNVGESQQSPPIEDKIEIGVDLQQKFGETAADGGVKQKFGKPDVKDPKGEKAASVAGSSNFSINSQKLALKLQYLKQVDKLQDLVEQYEQEQKCQAFELKKKERELERLNSQLNTSHPDFDEQKVLGLQKEILVLKAAYENAAGEFQLFDSENGRKIKKLHRMIEMEKTEFEGNVTNLEEEAHFKIDNPDLEAEKVRRVSQYVDNLGQYREEISEPVLQLPESPAMAAAIDKIGDNLKVITAEKRQVSAADRLATRQTLGRDLPQFSGQPENWPVFISAFESTTKACGFTDEENIERVRKCLKGEAYQSVKGLFGSTKADTLNDIMSLLRKKYGQPKLVINALIASVKECAPVKDGHPETN